jgi:hypothetical protein
MSFLAKGPRAYSGEVIGNGHCVPYVQLVADAPHTSRWRRGERVRDAGVVPVGTVIATFGGDPPRYQNRTDGSSHAAVLIDCGTSGLQVWDQWVGHPVAQRTIRYKNGTGLACDDGDQYFIVEPAEEPTTA